MEELDFIKVETHPNRDIQTYHVRCPLLKREKYKEHRYDAKEDIFRATKFILQSLKEVIGIEDAYCHNMYSLSVEKGQAFTWDELTPMIIEIIFSLDKASENKKKQPVCLRHIGGERRRRDAPCICGKHRDSIEFLIEINHVMYEACK